MPRVTQALVNATGGEFTPLLDARIDWQKYGNGARTIENMVPLVWGALTRRPPTRYVTEVKDSTKRTGLLPFEYSTLTAYVIEVGDQYFRFIKDRGQIFDLTATIEGASQTNPVVINATGHPFSNGNQVVATAAGGMVELNNRRFTVANAAANTLELSGVDGTGYAAFTAGGTIARPYELATPYLQADLFDAANRLRLGFTQSADVMYLVHPAYAPRKLSRTGHTAWSIAEIDFIDGPYLDERSDLTITPSAPTGSVTLTASAALFAATDVGRLVRLKHSSTWSWAKITAYTSATQVTATVRSATTTASASTGFRLGAWSATTGYPETVTFFEERLVFGKGQRIDASQAANFETFAPGTADDDAWAYSLASDRVDQIRALVPAKRLIALTQGSERPLGGTTVKEAITPTNVTAPRETVYGCLANLRPVQVGNSVLFPQRSGIRWRELAYRFEVDSFEAPDMNRYADHIGAGGFVAAAYQGEPHSILWVARADGVLLSFTYQRAEEVLAWARHPLGGTAAKVEALATIPTDDFSHGDNQDQLWAVVSRTIGGVTKRYIEYLAPFATEATNAADMGHGDCQMIYSGAAATAISGLAPLGGETVDIWADAALTPAQAVPATGKISLDLAAAKVLAGLPTRARWQPMKLEAAAFEGTAQGKQKMISRLTVRVLRSGALKYGRAFDALFAAPFRQASDAINAAVPLFTGDLPLAFDGRWETEGNLAFEVTGPAPCTILGVFPVVSTHDG